MKQKNVASQTSQRLHQHPTAADYQVSTIDFIKVNLKNALKLFPIILVIFLLWLVLTFVIYGIFGG